MIYVNNASQTDAKQSLHSRFVAINKTMTQIKLNKRNKATVDMSKQRSVLNHIHEISKSIYHIWIHFPGTVWPPSASNISVERRHVIGVARCASRALPTSFRGVSFDLLMSQAEPTQLAMMCYKDEGLEGIHRARTRDYCALFWAVCHQTLVLDWNQLKRWWCDKPNVTEPLSADAVIRRADSVIQCGWLIRNGWKRLVSTQPDK